MLRRVMRFLAVAGLVGGLLMPPASLAQMDDAPDWAKREFEASPDKIFAAALRSIQIQKHEVKYMDKTVRTVDFRVGITAWSWGYTMKLIVRPIDDKHSRVVVGVARSGGKTFSWGSGKKEVRKILAGIDAELAAAQAGLN